ncbi:biotin carboxylase N-terminal domain-containing protein [Candidatus Solincola tengchongensis]|uniref:biotin carboxylase N-terminal domain-containing protein n=1 Tax=Candidatus Solincola tengchongensis TaxID=2900693 RepID=UPI00257CD826
MRRKRVPLPRGGPKWCRRKRKRVLIANRGEIALRILRACRLLGLETAGIYSKADADALHLKYVDRKVCVGPASSGESYLNIRNIIGAAEISGADAVHPGYGFLAENEEFARACMENGLVFIGPSPESLVTGHKARAREAMAERQAGQDHPSQ